MYTIQSIASVITCTSNIITNSTIQHLLIDSRKLVFPNTTLFFALHTQTNNGHNYIDELYARGVKNFVVENNFNTQEFPEANFLKVSNTLQALQSLAAFHRSQFSIPVIGITGSNGKTIVKEWLYQLLLPEYNIVRSPRSYNSQIGVPLSVWQINAQNTLAIFEAGISTINEMQQLQNIIKPTIAILTNIGNAHNNGFNNSQQKLQEKAKLFANAATVIANKHTVQTITNSTQHFFLWSKTDAATFTITQVQVVSNSTSITCVYNANNCVFTIPFTDNAYVENAITCICTMLQLNYSVAVIQQRIQQLQPVEMRLQLKKAINNCTLINDSYSNDVSSLSIALDYLQQQSNGNNTTVILSDVLQSSIPENELYANIAAEFRQRNIAKFIGIGLQLKKYQQLFSNAIPKTSFYDSVTNFLQQNTTHNFKDEFILLKGARVFSFETINAFLEKQVHQTVMEINLTAMAYNLKQYQQLLQPNTKIMAMVKAFSYGSGSAEVARLLQFNKVDYLAVAYADEGIELRKAGIYTPIMVMNADEASFNALVEYNLEPEIYCFSIYTAFHNFLLQQGLVQFPVHIKINTGMNRLGFNEEDIESLATYLQQYNTMAVLSVFSHLASSEDEKDDTFTMHQYQIFGNSCNTLQQKIGYNFIKHIANTAAIFRHPKLQLNMVRLGIGLYGVDTSNATTIQLQTVATLKSTIAQIRKVKAHESIGYNRKAIVEKDAIIAVIRIGYADGLSRKMSNGIGNIWVKNKPAKIIGNVCMDMVMVDITHIENVQEGDEVEIFGKNIPVQTVANWCNTISYEIFTSISQRVKRIYFEE